MRRWLAGGLAALLLVTGAQAAGPQKVREREPLREVLTVTLEDCGSIKIRETEAGRVSFSGDGALYKTDLGTGSVDIRQMVEDEEAYHNPPLLEIPAGRYSRIQIEVVESGVSVRPSKADYDVTVREGAFALQIEPAYSGRITADAADSALSVVFLGREPESLCLTAKTEDCALDAPKDWKWARDEDDFSKTWGSGAGRLEVTAADSAVSFLVNGVGESRYQDAPGTASMIRTSSGEVAISDPGEGFFPSGDKRGDAWKALRAASTPNTETAIKTVPAKGVTVLQVNAQFCGVAVEPSESGAFELTYVGVENTKDITVETAVKDGVLTVTCTGTLSERYMNTSSDFRVNTVRVGVPEGILTEISLDCGVGNILVNGLNVPVRGVETSGLTRVAGDRVASDVNLITINGAAAVQGGTVSADVTLSTTNGSALLKADTVTGKTDLSAINGSVQVEVDRLENAVLQAVNGSVNAEVGTVGNNVFAGVENGSLHFNLTRQPQDLTFRMTNGWGGRLDLPDGWKDGYTVGNGKPVLKLSTGNGTLDFTVGGKKA